MRTTNKNRINEILTKKTNILDIEYLWNCLSAYKSIEINHDDLLAAKYLVRNHPTRLKIETGDKRFTNGPEYFVLSRF